MDCVLCPNPGACVCFCAGIALCQNHFEKHKEALPLLNHYSEEIKSNKNKVKEALEMISAERNKWKEYVTDKENCLRTVLIGLTEKLNSFSKLSSKINDYFDDLEKNVEKIGLQLVGENKEMVRCSINIPDFSDILNQISYSTNYLGPSFNKNLYHLKKDSLRILNTRTCDITTVEIPDLKPKVSPFILEIPAGILVTGGSTHLGMPQNDVMLIDIETKQIVHRQNLNEKRFYHSGVLFDGHVYIVGGMGSHGLELSIVEKYSIKTDTWETINETISARRTPGVCIFKNYLYVAGGDKFDYIERINIKNNHLEPRISINQKLSDGVLMVATDFEMIIFSSKKILAINENGNVIYETDKGNKLNW